MELHKAVTSTPHYDDVHARLSEWATFQGVACYTIPFVTIYSSFLAVAFGLSSSLSAPRDLDTGYKEDRENLYARLVKPFRPF